MGREREPGRVSATRVYKQMCPGTLGKPCPARKHLRSDSKGGLCSLCRSLAVAGGQVLGVPVTPRKPEVLVLDMERDVADAALSRIRALIRDDVREVVAWPVLEQLVLSVYQQGLADGDQLARMGIGPARDVRRA